MNPAPAPVLVLDVDQLAALLRCKPDTVRAACRSGDLPGIKWGEDWTIPAGALAQRAAGLRQRPEAQRYLEAIRSSPFVEQLAQRKLALRLPREKHSAQFQQQSLVALVYLVA
jgi:hypothetical protein